MDPSHDGGGNNEIENIGEELLPQEACLLADLLGPLLALLLALLSSLLEQLLLVLNFLLLALFLLRAARLLLAVLAGAEALAGLGDGRVRQDTHELDRRADGGCVQTDEPEDLGVHVDLGGLDGAEELQVVDAKQIRQRDGLEHAEGGQRRLARDVEPRLNGLGLSQVEGVGGIERLEEAEQAERAAGDVEGSLQLLEAGLSGHVDRDRVCGHELGDQDGVRCQDHEK